VRDLWLAYEDVAALSVLPGPLLHELITAFRSPLEAAGLETATLSDPDVLWAKRLELPRELVDAIHRIRGLANREGVERITNAAGGPLFAGELDRVPLVFAVRTRIEHPELFDRAVGRQFTEPEFKFREFVGQDSARSWREADLSRGAGLIGAAFGQRGRGAHCRIHAWVERDSNLFFSIEHDGIPTLSRAMVDGQLKTVTCLPVEHDLVVYDVRLGRLRVSAVDTAMVDVYVRLFGELLFGAEDWFHSSVVVTLEPLRGLGSRVLEPTPGILEARVVRLELASRATGGGLIITRAADVLRMLSEQLVDANQHGPARAATFHLKMIGERTLRRVSVEVPDLIQWDWRRGDTAIRHFLEERGLLRGSAGGASWQVA
jgi:hypothetical protein